MGRRTSGLVGLLGCSTKYCRTTGRNPFILTHKLSLVLKDVVEIKELYLRWWCNKSRNCANMWHFSDKHYNDTIYNKTVMRLCLFSRVLRYSGHLSVRPSITLYFFGVNGVFGLTAHAQMLHWPQLWPLPSAHPHATGVAVYPALFVITWDWCILSFCWPRY